MESKIFVCELQLLGRKASQENDADNAEINLHCLECVWDKSQNPEKEDNFEGYLVKTITQFLASSSDETAHERQLLILKHGIICLQLFVQNTWTGPPIDDKMEYPLNKLLERPITLYFGSNFGDIGVKIKDIANKSLSEDLFDVKITHLEYLWMAKLLLCSCHQLLDRCSSAAWWSLRCLFTYQRLFERSPTLYEMIKKLIDKGIVAEPLMTDTKYKSLQVQFHLEVAQIFSFYYNISQSKEHFNSAQKLAGMLVSVTGALGKRTRYQQEAKSQLLLKLEFTEERLNLKPLKPLIPEDIPKDCLLNDSDRLNSIEFTDEANAILPDLLPEEQAVLLNAFFQIQKSNAVNELITEELMTYLNAILSQPKNWSIQTTALFCRSVLESKQRRTIERSMMQLQMQVDDYSKLVPPATRRIALFHCSLMPSLYEVERKLANILKEMGVISSALEIYLRLELWEDIIECYRLLQKRHQAEDIIKQRLAIKETPVLWCHLGDATGDSEHYIRAWELSGFRCARAQTSLGKFHFNRKEYAQSIPHFQKSLEINSFQLEAWSALAYAALQIENWDLTATAYRHCLDIEPDNFQAWNNLSNAYIKLNQKPRAWKTLQEALRCNYDDWRIWENYLLVSIDCGAFEEALQAYHRILDLKEKHLDLEVLSILVKAVSQDLPDYAGQPSKRLSTKALQLFGRLTSQITNCSKLWDLYAELTSLGDLDNIIVCEKVLQFLQRAHRYAVLKHGWEKDKHQREDVINTSDRLADGYIRSSNLAELDQSVKLLDAAKLMLNGVISKLKLYEKSLVTSTEEIDTLQVLELKLKIVEEKLNAVR